jgi:hypothetical protein
MTSENSPVCPIIIAEGHDVMAFRDLAAAQQKLEVVDVEEGIFTAWDAEGRLLDVHTVSMSGRFGVSEVRIALGESEPGHADALRNLLVTVLETYWKKEVAERPLAEVVKMFVETAGYTR